jgi:glycosyltransferase involved in cell wall biosynthesis
MKKLNIFFIRAHWCIGGIETFERNLILELEKYENIIPHILLVPNYDEYLFNIDFPEDLKEYVYECKISPFMLLEEKIKLVKNYILQFENNIVIADQYFYFHPLALETDINFIYILHADEDIQYFYACKYKNIYSKIVSVSNLIKKKLELLDIKSEYIPYGVDVSLFNKKIEFEKKEKIKLVYCGRIEQEQKRVLDFIELIKELEKLNIKYEFNIIGEGRYLEVLKKELKDYNVIFYGKKTEKEIAKILKEMDILVMVSDFEGLPLVILEAINSGVIPVITNFLNENRLKIKDISNIGDMKHMAKVIEKYYKDEKLLYKDKLYYQKIGKEFSSKNMAKKYMKIFDEVIEHSLIKNKNKDGLLDFLRRSNMELFIDEILKRDMIIIKNSKIAIYGFGRAGKLVFDFLQNFNITLKFIIDDSLSSEFSITFEEFTKRIDEVNVVLIGKYQNIYHKEIFDLKVDILRLEYIK